MHSKLKLQHLLKQLIRNSKTTIMNTIIDTLTPIFEASLKACFSISNAEDTVRVKVLSDLATEIDLHRSEIIAENQKDVVRMDDNNPKKDRLILNEGRIEGLIASLHAVGQLPDPSGQIVYNTITAEGLKIEKKTVPIGVVGIIYESRPNVTVDVAALCLRSGNCAILRGGSDAFHSNVMLVKLIHNALTNNGIDTDCVQLLPTDRNLVKPFLEADRYIDIIIPRGSQQLIDFVRENAKVPTIETGAGVCHTYVNSSANLAKAATIVVNAKVSRPSVCNALDTILVDQSIASDFLPMITEGMNAHEVEIFADDQSYTLLSDHQYPLLQKAVASDFGREFLDFKCSVKVVSGYEEAVSHIRTYSSRHSEAIISEDVSLLEKFLNDVDAAAVYSNASTRFTDGGVFGLGAEIGISTQKLHARGPFALEKLITEKWVIRGNGQIRN